MDVPDRLALTIKQVYAIYAQGLLSRISQAEAARKHWIDDTGKWAYPIGVDNDGDLVWLAQDSSGRIPIVEQSGSAISINSTYLVNELANHMELGRINALGLNPRTQTVSQTVKRVDMELTLGAGGTLAATSLVAAQAAKNYYPEELHLELDPVAVDLSALGGNSARVVIQDDAGVPIIGMAGHISNQHPVLHNRLGAELTTNQDMDILIEAGTGGNLGASKIRGYVLYRELA